ANLSARAGFRRTDVSRLDKVRNSRGGKGNAKPNTRERDTPRDDNVGERYAHLRLISWTLTQVLVNSRRVFLRKGNARSADESDQGHPSLPGQFQRPPGRCWQDWEHRLIGRTPNSPQHGF